MSPVHGQLLINEIYFDPPGAADQFNEYIELRGPADMSLQDHYLIFIENEQSAIANPGVIENIFDFGAIGESGASIGSNGFLLLRQAFNQYQADNIAPGTEVHVNTGSTFTWGSGPSSTVGHSDVGEDGSIENSGFTAMLIKVDIASGGLPPALLQDLDADDDSELDVSTGAEHWTVLDSIGVNSEISDINGLLYAPVNFSAGELEDGGNFPAGAEFFNVGAEIEYLGRWGDSTGSSLADWHASNLTNDGNAGYVGPDDFRQAGDPHGVGIENQFVETSQGMPYGAMLTGTLGAPNRFALDGDFEYDATDDKFDGDVDGGDLLVWQRNFGFGIGLGTTSGSTATREHGDADRNRVVDEADLKVWEENFGTGGSAAVTTTAVPEPTSILLLFVGVTGVTTNRRVESSIFSTFAIRA